MIYIYFFIVSTNILRGYYLLNKKIIEEDVKYYTDEEAIIWYYRPTVSRIVTGVKWIIKIEIPLLIPSFIFPFVFSIIYLKNFSNIFSSTNFLFALKMFIISEVAIMIGGTIKIIDYVVNKD
jgi:hypothetical protein